MMTRQRRHAKTHAIAAQTTLTAGASQPFHTRNEVPL